MTQVGEHLQAILTLGPIVGLLVLGFGLTLRSGVVGAGAGQGMRRLVGNLSQTLILTTGCLIGLALVQQFVGFRSGLIW